jgi:F420-non-reducing hydrogenase iron-sulfur subunit
MLKLVETALKDKKDDERRVLIFANDMCGYKLADSVGTAKKVYSDAARIIRVPSTSRVSPKLMLQAFSMGADAILLADCEAKSTQYPGSLKAAESFSKTVKSILAELGENPERVRLFQFATVMLPHFVKHVNSLAEISYNSKPISAENREKIKQNIDRWLFNK